MNALDGGNVNITLQGRVTIGGGIASRSTILNFENIQKDVQKVGCTKITDVVICVSCTFLLTLLRSLTLKMQC